jgi:hypothetical protein
VRHVDRRRADALVHGLDLAAHHHAQLRVEIGEGLVEQEHLRIADDRPPHGDALALAAGKLAGVALKQVFQAEDRGRLLHAIRGIAGVRRLSFSAKPMLSSTVMCG